MSNTRRCPGEALIWMMLKHRIRARPHRIHYHPRFPTSTIPTGPPVSQIVTLPPAMRTLAICGRRRRRAILTTPTTAITASPAAESRIQAHNARAGVRDPHRHARLPRTPAKLHMLYCTLRPQRRVWVTTNESSLSSSGTADTGLARPGAKTKVSVAGTLSRVQNRVVWTYKAETRGFAVMPQSWKWAVVEDEAGREYWSRCACRWRGEVPVDDHTFGSGAC